MNHKLFLLAAFALIMASCTHENEPNVVETSHAASPIQATATMPESNATTRTTIEQAEGSKDIIVKWKTTGDKINLFFVQGATIAQVEDVPITNVRQENKKGDFSFTLPTEIDEAQAYIVYGVHGAASSVSGGKINVEVSPFTSEFNSFDMPMTFKQDVAAGATLGNVTFAHLGTLVVVTLKNASATDLFVDGGPYMINSATGEPDYTQLPSAEDKILLYDLVGQTTEEVTGTTAVNETQTTMAAGATAVFAAWIVPNSTVPGESKLVIEQGAGNPVIYSSTTKPARSTALQKGRAYHVYAVWNGTTLKLTNETLIPPLEMDELTLTGDLMHAANGSDFIGMVYSKGDGNVYYNAAQTDGTWGGEVSLSTGTQARIAIDDNNHPHVVYTTTDNKIAYLKYDGTVWSTPVYIESNNGGACSKPDIDVDNQGYAHISYSDTKGNTGAYTDKTDIMYALNSSGNFVKTLICDGYYELYGGADAGAEYYDKESYIVVNNNGDYFIITHRYGFSKWMGGSDRNYSIIIKTNSANGGSSSSSTDKYHSYDLEFNGTDVLALYKDNNVNQKATITISGTTASFTSPQSISTAIAPHSLSTNASNTAIGGLTGSNLFSKYNALENTYTDVTVKTATKVGSVNVSGNFYAVYTDNADSKIKIKKMATE